MRLPFNKLHFRLQEVAVLPPGGAATQLLLLAATSAVQQSRPPREVARVATHPGPHQRRHCRYIDFIDSFNKARHENDFRLVGFESIVDPWLARLA